MKRFLRNSQIIDGIVVTALGLWLFIHSIIHFRTARIKAPWIMSPYLFPMILGGTVILLGLLLLIPEIIRQIKATCRTESRSVRVLDVIVILAISILYDIIMRYVGFIPSTVLMLLAMIAFLGERRPKILIPVAVLTPIVLTLIFKVALGVRLP